jgi:hypothetical protein
MPFVNHDWNKSKFRENIFFSENFREKSENLKKKTLGGHAWKSIH